MADFHEESYLLGQKAIWRRIIIDGLRFLDGNERTEAAIRLERAETVAKLREVCDEYGDNDWPDDLDLVDVLEKHLLRHLWDNHPTPTVGDEEGRDG